MRTLALLALLIGCSGATPRTAEDCAGLAEGKARDECYLTVLVDVFKADPAAGVKMVESGITDPVNKDFAWYQATKNVDPHSNKYCDRIEDDTLAARCRTIVARPHLHRDLTGKGGAGGPPGGAGGPPGGAASGADGAAPTDASGR